MSKINEIKGKIKDKATEAKDVIVDNKDVIVPLGVAAGVLIGGIALSKHNSKKFEAMWRAAKKAYDEGNLDYDFGPYKVMKIFEPKTGEFIGETLCHESATTAFLNVK